MKLQTTLLAAAVTAGGLAIFGAAQNADAQNTSRYEPERRLVGVTLGQKFAEVFRRYGQPDEVQTVALASDSQNLPGVGGSMGPGASGFGGAGGPGGFPGASGFGGAGGPGGFPGASGFGGAGGPGGFPGMAGMGGGGGKMGAMAGGGMSGGFPGAGAEAGGFPGAGGMGGFPGAGGMGGSPTDGGFAGGLPGAGQLGPGATGPEFSTAQLFVYKRKGGIRMEFLVNEDGRVAQISVAAPAGKTLPNAITSKGIKLGSNYQNVLSRYGFPERLRNLPGYRFQEAYFSKVHHAAFTFDALKKMQCVRMTIALAD